MKKKFKISIIVPIYNAKKTLRRCIKSILSQTYTDFELILINDGSTDSSINICNEYKYDKRVTLINKKNEGSVKARIDGINLARGEYITFIDADDWIDKNTFLLLYQEEEKNEFDILCFNSFKVIGKMGLVKRQGNRSYFSKNKLYCGDEIKDELISAWLYGHPFPATLWGKFYKKDIILNTGKYSKEVKFFYDDLMTNFEVFMRAKSVKVVDKSLYYYRYGGGTSKYMPEFFCDVIKTYNVQKSIINSEYKSSKSNKENGISIMLLNTLKTCITNLFLSNLSEDQIKNTINKYIDDESIKEASQNNGSICYFDVDFIKAINDCDFNYLYDLGIREYKRIRIKKKVISTLNDII